MKNWNTCVAAMATVVVITGLCRAVEVSAPAEPMSVWFDKPAKSFHESCVLGNGRLGAMDFGGVGKERIALNESSVWSGGPYDGNKYDAYQCLPKMREKLFTGDISGAGGILGNSFRYADGVSGWGDVNQFGCYQTLGDLIVDFDNNPEAKLSSPSGHSAGDGNSIENTVDGNAGSKWCVNNGNTPVSWQMCLPAAQTVNSYAFTSGNDVPDRDPRSWVLEGSANGKAWVELDRRARTGRLRSDFRPRRSRSSIPLRSVSIGSRSPPRSGLSKWRKSAWLARSSRRPPGSVTVTAAISI